MKAIIYSAGIILLWFMAPVCRGQQLITISDPRLELRDNIVYVSYDILNSDRDVKYTVRLEVKDSTGQKIDARALAGDIGEGITGGGMTLKAWSLNFSSICSGISFDCAAHFRMFIVLRLLVSGCCGIGPDRY